MKGNWKRTLMKYAIFGGVYFTISIAVDFLLDMYSEAAWVVVLGVDLQFLNIAALLFYNARSMDADYEAPYWMSFVLPFTTRKPVKKTLYMFAFMLILTLVICTTAFIIAHLKGMPIYTTSRR